MLYVFSDFQSSGLIKALKMDCESYCSVPKQRVPEIKKEFSQELLQSVVTYQIPGVNGKTVSKKVAVYCMVIIVYLLIQIYCLQSQKTYYALNYRYFEGVWSSGVNSCDRSTGVLAIKGSDDDFQKAGPHTYVYSAYYDDRRLERVIRIIGVSALNASIFCHLWTSETDSLPLIVEAEVKPYQKTPE